MNINRMDALLEHQKNFILKVLQKECQDIGDGTYYLTSLTHDILRMLMSIMNRNMPQQEAKAAYKVALDTVIADFGLSVMIHEFN